MDVTKVPFVKKVGILKTANGNLELKYNHSVYNHIKTIHASAQFALAETSSGEILQRLFPELAGKVVPVVRESSIKYKNPAIKDIFAYPSVAPESISKFKNQFSKKGRALITVCVEVRDSTNTITCTGIFKWFVQNIET